MSRIIYVPYKILMVLVFSHHDIHSSTTHPQLLVFVLPLFRNELNDGKYFKTKRVAMDAIMAKTACSVPR
jgi:hypothetical protein